jgi:5'-nucleotidase/UDP-sugar diphosphatase
VRHLPLVLLLAACKNPEDTDPADTDGDTDVTGDGKLRFTVLHTNDWQSHLVGSGPNAEYTPLTTGDDGTIGGAARLKALVTKIRDEKEHQVVLFDAGDWMAGALFQELRTSHAAELQLMQDIGYDAITLGNHEFDWGPAVLGEMISKADSLGVTVPIVASNTVPDPVDAADDPLEAHFTSGRIRETMVLELENGLTLGLFGLVGDGAAQITPAVEPASFTPAAEAAAAAVADLEAQGVDLVFAINHVGVDLRDPSNSEDQILATEVPGIDVIVGGHSHTPLTEPIVTNGTVIVQAGQHTERLGQLDLAFDPETGTLEVEAYTLHTLDDTVVGDAAVAEKVDGFVDALDAGPVGEMGYAFAQPVVELPGDVRDGACVESPVGHLVTDAFVGHLNDLGIEPPIDVAFEAQGVLRGGLKAGETGVEAFSDVFEILPLGKGLDDRPGYALVHFWVTPAELRDACEVTASIAPDYGCNYWFEISGLRCTMNMSGLKTMRVYQVELWTGSEWTTLDISTDNADLYHIAVDSYVASLLGLLDPLSSGALSVVAKDADGVPYSTLDEMLVDADPELPGIQEVKLWEALVGYAESFPDSDGDGVPELPETYLEPAGRVVGYE